ncbi:MAG: CpaF family protein [Chloroflexi bacterium]|nr:MAG: CpaF family protein [Chloroflexota bacterium]TME49597.1 MAG: CpaF family protein [Chloroflexota bacterium]
MLLVDKLNKGKLPEKPDKGEPAAPPALSSLVVKPQGIAARVPNVDRIKKAVHERLIQSLGLNSDTASSDLVQRRIAELVDEYCEEAKLKLTKHDRDELAELIMHDVLGLGPLESLLEDPEVSEIMVNGPKTIFAERRGRLTQSELVFENERELRRVIDRIVARIGRRVDESSPMVDARLPDGSRVNIVIPPLAVQGSSITIRKFSRVPYKVQDLVTFGTLNNDMANFIRACVRSRISMVVSGGTGSGKTTTLNVLSNFIPDTERVVTVEDTAELQLRQRNLVSLEARSANVEGRGAVAIRDLVVNALRMRPDRIVVGECRAGETLDMLQAMNTGHDGSMTTVHANSPKDAINRLETMVIMGGSDLPFQAIREQIVGGITLMVQQARLRDGRRVVTHISEITGINGNHIQLQDICLFDQTGIDEEGNVLGTFRWTGIVPKLLPRLKANGEDFSTEVFGQSGLQVIEGQPRHAGGGAALDATAD